MEENHHNPFEQEERRPPFDMKTFHYFANIIKTIFYGFFVMMAGIFFGLYLGYGDPKYSTPKLMTIFYVVYGIVFLAYLFFVFKMWRKHHKEHISS
ncbi:hypothetical protein COR50_05025 [Chitinophaga caeni]|uniref:Uncharacterized protein n=1 Tax=Chitinophaga caeni TaxID=2029983 RepID=A0A291QRS1_9BACT|nr:hypothetical protein [Chitinophaga caeni]ATL46593.1 hypothetical protein COR50_05025 [Chitinophaga caeni]